MFLPFLTGSLALGLSARKVTDFASKVTVNANSYPIIPSPAVEKSSSSRIPGQLVSDPSGREGARTERHQKQSTGQPDPDRLPAALAATNWPL